MQDGQREMVSPRIARMLRELEGPCEDLEVATSRSRGEMGRRAPLARERRVLASVLLMAGAAIVVAMVAVQARAPADNDRHAANGATADSRHLTDASRLAPSARDRADSNAR